MQMHPLSRTANLKEASIGSGFWAWEDSPSKCSLSLQRALFWQHWATLQPSIVQLVSCWRLPSSTLGTENDTQTGRSADKGVDGFSMIPETLYTGNKTRGPGFIAWRVGMPFILVSGKETQEDISTQAVQKFCLAQLCVMESLSLQVTGCRFIHVAFLCCETEKVSCSGLPHPGVCAGNVIQC